MSSRRFFIRKWSCNICQFNDSLPSQSRAIRSQTQKNVKLEKNMALFFRIVRVHVIRQMFKLQFRIEKWTPDVLTLATTFHNSRSCAISFQRPKCANAYDAVGNWRVKEFWFGTRQKCSLATSRHFQPARHQVTATRTCSTTTLWSRARVSRSKHTTALSPGLE